MDELLDEVELTLTLVVADGSEESQALLDTCQEYLDTYQLQEAQQQWRMSVVRKWRNFWIDYLPPRQI